MGQQKRTIALDFDGVLHFYSKGWHNGTIYDCPVPDAVESIHKLLHRKNINIVIQTAREDHEAIRAWIKEWFDGWEPEIYPKPIALMYIDDRGVRFTNWKDILNYF